MRESNNSPLKYYITLDYELFLGEDSGTVDGCLIEPTRHLLDLLNHHGIKATFFVDVALLLKLRELKNDFSVLEGDYHRICNHVRKLAGDGHSIQLHFHPQWLYSAFNNGKWSVDQKHYKIDDLSDEEINQKITDGINLLNTLTPKPVSSFRAGGYTLNDFSRVRNVFRQNGINKDSSVLRGVKFISQYQRYDYSSVPAFSHYRFEDNITEYNEIGNFTEYPISTMPVGILRSNFDRIRIKYAHYLFMNNSKWGDGRSVRSTGSNKSIIKRISNLIRISYRVASIDGVQSLWLDDVCKHSAKYGNEVVIIGHPKLITPLSIMRLSKFIDNNKERVLFDVF